MRRKKTKNITFQKWLYIRRVSSGLETGELAHKAGVANSTISHIERTPGWPVGRNMARLSDAKTSPWRSPATCPIRAGFSSWRPSPRDRRAIQRNNCAGHRAPRRHEHA